MYNAFPASEVAGADLPCEKTGVVMIAANKKIPAVCMVSDFLANNRFINCLSSICSVVSREKMFIDC